MKNIVWLTSYPKSGNTWFRMFLSNYLKNSDNPVSLEEIEHAPIAGSAVDFEEIVGLNPFELTADEVDLWRPDMYRFLSEEYAKNEETCYKKVHDAYTINANKKPLFPEEVSRGAVYFVRNPLDVCVSFANHSANKIEKTVDLVLNENASLAGKKSGQLRQILKSWKSHIESWQSQSLIPVHFVRYEDMLQKPMETFELTIRFLGLEYEEQRLKRAIFNSDFKLLQQMEKENGFNEKLQFCKSFFWKGKIGNYKDYLTAEQISWIVEYNYDTMREFEYINEEGILTV